MSTLVVFGKNNIKSLDENWSVPDDAECYSLLSGCEKGEFCDDLFKLLNEKIAKKINYNNIYLIGVSSSFNSENIVRLLISSCGMVTKNKVSVIEADSYAYTAGPLINRICNCLDLNSPSIITINESIINLQFEFSKKDIPYMSIRNASGYVTNAINKTKISTNDALNLMVDSFKNKKGFSFIRINHCENRLLGFEYTYGKSDANDTYDIQFGEQLNQEETHRISELMAGAVRNSSLLGVPVLSHITNRKLGILENSTFVHLRDKSLLGNIPLTDVNIHLKLFSKHEFGHFLKSLPKVVLITCRNSVVKILEDQLGINVHLISIPGEYKFATNHESHYNDCFDNVMSQIANEVNPGDVVLVGAGILGKIYCNQVKRMNGIGIDIGSLFDAIAGEQTRGSGFPEIEWIKKSAQI